MPSSAPAAACCFIALLAYVSPVMGQTTPVGGNVAPSPWARPAAAEPPGASVEEVGRPPARSADATGLGGRVVAEVLGAVVGVGAGVGLGLGLTCVLPSGRDCDRTGDVASTMVTAGAFAMPVGVYTAGTLAGGRGSLGYTMLGGLTGALLSVPVIALSDSVDAKAAGAVAVIVLPVLGSILGYEWSAPSRPAPGAATARRGLGASWSLGVAPRGRDGAMVGVSARF